MYKGMRVARKRMMRIVRLERALNLGPEKQAKDSECGYCDSDENE